MEIKKFGQIEETEGPKNYMFFSNLKTIKKAVDSLLELDQNSIDQMLDEHDWASEHIATAKDDLEEVSNFFNNRLGEK